MLILAATMTLRTTTSSTSCHHQQWQLPAPSNSLGRDSHTNSNPIARLGKVRFSSQDAWQFKAPLSEAAVGIASKL